MRVLDLFSGIGGFGLGLERAGMSTVAFCEADGFCQGILRKHWPETPIYDDVRTLTAGQLASDGIVGIDAIVGGFPCQPHSLAGKREGVADPRHLWPEFARLIGEIRPRWVIGENVPGIRSTAADLVMGDLEALGYACEAVLVGAGDIGAPHKRQRVWFLAYAAEPGRQAGPCRSAESTGAARSLQPAGLGRSSGNLLAEASQRGRREQRRTLEPGEGRHADGLHDALGHAEDHRLALGRRLRGHLLEELATADRAGRAVVWPRRRALAGVGRAADGVRAGLDDAGLMFPTPAASEYCGNASLRADGSKCETRPTLVGMARYGLWPTPGGFAGGGSARGGDRHAEPANLAGAVRMLPTPTVHGNYAQAGEKSGDGLNTAVVEGFPVEPWERDIARTVPRRTPWRTQRLKALGNAVVPQVVEAIGRAIIATDAEVR